MFVKENPDRKKNKQKEGINCECVLFRSSYCFDNNYFFK